MSGCRVVGAQAQKESAPAEEEMSFELTIDVAETLLEDAVFKCMYIVDADNPKTDVELESIDVGNGPGLTVGLMKFTLDVPCPSRAVIQSGGMHEDVAGMYIAGLYRDTEFCRVGYYVRHEYTDPDLIKKPPEVVDWSKLERVLSEPCVTRFAIPWDQPTVPLPCPAVDQPSSVDAGQLPEVCNRVVGDDSGDTVRMTDCPPSQEWTMGMDPLHKRLRHGDR